LALGIGMWLIMDYRPWIYYRKRKWLTTLRALRSRDLEEWWGLDQFSADDFGKFSSRWYSGGSQVPCLFWPAVCQWQRITFGFLGGGLLSLLPMLYYRFLQSKKVDDGKRAFFSKGSWFYEVWLIAKSLQIEGCLSILRFDFPLDCDQPSIENGGLPGNWELEHAGSRLNEAAFLLWEMREGLTTDCNG